MEEILAGTVEAWKIKEIEPAEEKEVIEAQGLAMKEQSRGLKFATSIMDLIEQRIIHYAKLNMKTISISLKEFERRQGASNYVYPNYIVIFNDLEPRYVYI